jgi:hypothetical protein
MRASLPVVLTVTLLTFNVSAQVTSVKEYPPQLDESTHTWHEVVENRDAGSIVAVHATFDCPTRYPLSSGRSVSFGASGDYDALANPVNIFDDHKGIPPGGAVTIAAADPSKCRGGVDAVIFSDGHIDGNSSSVNEYQQRWRGVHEGIIQSLPLLTKVANQESDLTEAEDALRHHMESIPDHPEGGFALKRWGERAVYFQLEGLLRTARETKSASEPTPDPQPRTVQVEANGIPGKQARKMAIALVSKLQEWETALEDGLGSPATKAEAQHLPAPVQSFK